MAMTVRNSGGGGSQTLNTLNKNNKSLSKSLGKVSSGMKINSAADGASEYAISERMRAQIRSLNQAADNTQNAGALLRVAEGAVMSSLDILRVMKERAIDSANDTNTDLDRQIMQKEFEQFVDQLDANANVTYNGKYLLDGSKKFAGKGATSVYVNLDIYGGATSGTQGLLLIRKQDDPTSGAASYPYRVVVPGDTVTINGVRDGESFSSTVTVVNNSNPVWDDLMNGVWGRYTPTNASATAGGYYDYFGHYIKERFGTPEYNKQGARVAGPMAQSSSVGLDDAINGFSFVVYDKDGNRKEDATKTLNNFKHLQFAEDPSEDNAMTFHIGAKSNETIKIGLKDMRSRQLGLRDSEGKAVQITTRDKAEAVISALDNAIQFALDQQTYIGAVQARLDHTADNLTIASENASKSESTIRDADMAKEMTEYTKNNVLLQASKSMLAQENQNMSSVLSLLQ